MKAIRNLLAAIALSICAACASVPAPQSVSEGIGFSYSTLATVRTTTAQALAAGTIKVADAKQVEAIADQARTLLDAARVALPAVNCATGTAACDTTTAAAKLALATSMLTQLQQYIAAQKK